MRMFGKLDHLKMSISDGSLASVAFSPCHALATHLSLVLIYCWRSIL